MPNWCYTSYVIDGKRKEVQSLFSKMNNLENRRKPLVDNSFGKTWLGCLVTKLGADWQKVYCRGSWSDLDWNGSILRFNTETAWGPMNEVFITNDTDGNYFKDRFRIEYDLDYEYFTTIEGVCTYVSGIIGKEVKTRADMEQAISDWNCNTEDDDKMIYFNAYEVVSE